MTTGILLVGHGTRDAQGTAEFHALAEQLRPRFADHPFEACLLELQPPDIATGVQRLLARGIERLVVAPLLLFAAGHAKADIPGAVSAALRNQSLPTTQAAVLDCHAEIVALSAERFRETLAGKEFVTDDATALVLIGRGSSDPAAIAALQRFADLRKVAHPQLAVRTAFVAVAEPKVASAAAELAAAGHFRRIVLQPHLLFHGELLRELQQLQQRLQAMFPQQEWLITDHLGAGIETNSRSVRQLVSAFAERIFTAIAAGTENSLQSRQPIHVVPSVADR